MIGPSEYKSEAGIRIGNTPCGQLSWAVKLIKKGKPQTDGEWQVLAEEIIAFAMHAGRIGLPAYRGDERGGDRYEERVFEGFLDMITLATQHEPIELPPARRGRVSYDTKTESYKEHYYDDDIVSASLRGLARRIVECGKLLRECKAPAKRRPGRKSKKQTTKPGLESTCATLFVAKRETQIYCSPECLNRTLTRKKRSKLRGKRRKPK